MDRTSVRMLAYVLSSYASKIGAMKRWKPMSWRQLRWAAAITRDCLSTITGGWRSSIRRMASIWGRRSASHRSQRHPRGRSATGRFSTHDDMEIDVALAARPSYIALGHVFPTQTEQMPSAPQGLERHGMLSAWRIIPPWRLAVSVWRAACGNGDGCRQYRRCQRHYSSRRLAFGNGTVAGNCRSWR